MPENPLYQDDRLRIEPHPNSFEDHLVYIKERNGEEINYILPRGVLPELAKVPRGGIERMISNFNAPLLHLIEQEGIGIDGLHVAICQAYIEQEERINRSVKEMLREKN